MSYKNSTGNKKKLSKLYNQVYSDYYYCPLCYFDKNKNRIIYRPFSRGTCSVSFWKKYANKKIRRSPKFDASRGKYKKLTDIKYKIW